MLLLASLRLVVPQVAADSAGAVVLDGNAAKLRVELGGGAVSDLHLPDPALNPLSWDSGHPGAGPRPRGHFLCLDRWGPPSDAEQRNGMPFHGEASRVVWRVLAPPTSKAGYIESELAAALPLAGLSVVRNIRLSRDAAVFTVSESVTNTNLLGRIYNFVQHATIAPPFLDEQTLVDSNGKRGFMQSSPFPNPELPSVEWRYALNKGVRVDLRRLSADPSPNVVSYTIDEEYGWTTASSISTGLLIGYIWKAVDYPWFNAWRHSENGRPAARGLEFGTTGLHQPFPVLVRKGPIFGRAIYAYLDASATEKRSYAGFLFRIPRDYRGVARITYAEGELRLYEHGRPAREPLTMKVGDILH
jgi:hypothetical protein